jgi:hypothetical protein
MNSINLNNRPTMQTALTPDQDLPYQTVSKSAVAALAFAILGLTSFLAPAFVLLPALGVGFGIVSLVTFARFPGEFVGKLAAQIGLGVSLVCLVASVAQHVYIYNTEVPEGYNRISYALLRDDSKTPLPYAEEALDLDGKLVFLKGYVRPGDRKENLKQFILTGDFGDCCFGGNPKISEVVAIDIKLPNKTVDYGYGLRRIGGTFRLNPQTAATGESAVPQVFYVIEADYVK